MMLWSHLRQNVKAGTELALFMPVRRLDFRVAPGDYVMLVLTSIAFWLLGSLLRTPEASSFDPHAFNLALAQIPIVLLLCLALARVLRDPSLLLAFAVIIVATDPIFEVVAVFAFYAARSLGDPRAGAIINAIFMLWSLSVLLRTQWLLSGWRGPRSLAAGAMMAGALAFFIWVYPRADPWTVAAPAEPAQPSVAREDLFHLQGGMLDSHLAQLLPGRPGVPDLYFVGVAPYGLQDTFAKELVSVRRLMEERFDTAGRSVYLVNHPAALRDTPIASVSNLRAALEHLANVIDVEEDIVMLHIATHGTADHRLQFELPPLQLQQLSPTALARMLSDSGIRWKVIVLSACYSGGFVEPLRDDNTLVITSADATHSSFGCEYESDYTWFSRAFYDQALRGTYSLQQAFEQARRSVSEREQAAQLPPSGPQIQLGEAIRGKLAELERRLAEGAVPQGKLTRAPVNALR